MELSASRTLTIAVPELITAQSIRYLEGCTDAELVCCITATNWSTGELVKTVVTHFIVPKSNTTSVIPAFESEPLPVDCIIAVAVQLVFYGNNSVSGRYALNTKKINPGILMWIGV